SAESLATDEAATGLPTSTCHIIPGPGYRLEGLNSAPRQFRPLSGRVHNPNPCKLGIPSPSSVAQTTTEAFPRKFLGPGSPGRCSLRLTPIRRSLLLEGGWSINTKRTSPDEPLSTVLEVCRRLRIHGQVDARPT